MKKLIIITALIHYMGVNPLIAQTTKPIKDTSLIRKVTTRSNFGLYHHFDYVLTPTINGDDHVKAWANKYKGKWYSNYPYTIKFSYNRHIIKIYENSVFVCAFTNDGHQIKKIL